MDTVRVCAPDGAQREVDGVTGLRYRSTDGVYDMHPADAAAYRRIGAFSASLIGATSPAVGYACVRCGFASFFTTCSRCGGECRKDAGDATA
jgi:hypothetical protein